MKKVLFSNFISEDPELVKDGKGNFMEISICSYDYKKEDGKYSMLYITILEEEDRGTSGVKCHLSTESSLVHTLNYVKGFFDEQELNELNENTKKYLSDVMMFNDGPSYLHNLKMLIKK